MNGELFRKFPDREGYNPDFLGVRLEMPTLDDSIKHLAAPLLSDPTKSELKYTHSSIVMNKERRTPLFTIVNIDGSQYQEFERDGKWVFDGRIAREHQMGNEAYSNNPIPTKATRFAAATLCGDLTPSRARTTLLSTPTVPCSTPT